jgi:hypothetical protein
VARGDTSTLNRGNAQGDHPFGVVAYNAERAGTPPGRGVPRGAGPWLALDGVPLGPPGCYSNVTAR